MILSADDVAWASKAMDEGRSLSYVASVLETSVAKAQKAIHQHRYGGPTPQERAQRYFAPPPEDIENDENSPENVYAKPGRKQKAALGDLAALRDRRKALLRRRFAKCWDMIWFLRRRHMSGRTLRQIYGADALIWSVGGGIDEGIAE